ncbi:MAG: hypothetical protein EU550_00575 [Promethearchaeota archaeon]|nr:MAG: hypothetical protein EU550_00575 [Candidatus Lokiarchaeota archaeon]
MPKYCEFCGEKIDYLPFSCKYCGGVYCKEHRLPENHECTFELKHTPTIPTDSKDVRHGIREYIKSESSRKETPESVRRYLKRENRKRRRESRLFQRTPQSQPISASVSLLIAIIIISIATIFLRDFFYSLGPVAYNFWKLVTGPFTYNFLDPMGFFFFIFFALFLYFMGSRTEFIYGRRFFIALYLISAYSKLLIFTGLQFAFIGILGINPYWIIPESLASSGFIGVLCFSIFPAMNTKIRILLCFIPVELKGKSFIFILSLFSLIPALLSFLSYLMTPIAPYFIYFISPLSDLGGILGSYAVYYYKFKY